MRARVGRVGVLGLAGLLPLACARPEAPHLLPAPKLPPLEVAYPLPALPERSARNANYAIEARLDTQAHTIQGSLVLEWRNTADRALSSFPFHLYWNAFRNNLSTLARGDARRRRRFDPDDQRAFGYTEVRSVKLLGASEADLTPTLRFVHPDDDNADDRTVMEVETPAPVPPGSTVRFKVDWTARIPHGSRGRAGWVHDYHFLAQWFPKIGVYWKGAWNSHQFHATSEFFADYGVYDVKLTVPEGFLVGATGALQGEPARNPDGTRTFRFYQEDVHDFTWVTSRRMLERRGRFADPGYPPVEIHALMQPEHLHLAERHIEAVKVALRSYGAWSAPYPYAQITVVDPAWNSGSGGMEYPTLLTAGTNRFAPWELQSPEGVTVHEAGHQFWYGLVGNNEFEEAWLDEGFNTYHTSKAMTLFYGPEGWGRRYFAPPGGRTGWPVVAPGYLAGRGEDNVPGLRQGGKADRMARRSWEYRNGESYGLNSYGKPALTLQTFEALVGDESMTRILRTFARRHRFGHPTTDDFLAAVKEVTGEDYRWFFDQTFFSSDLCDYAVTAKNEEARVPMGFVDGPQGRVVPAPSPSPSPQGKKKDKGGPWESEVVIERRGEVRMPVELLVQFADGSQQTESWDGQDRWVRFRYQRPAKVARAQVDPHGKLAIDVDPVNNVWVDEDGVSRRAATKWVGRFLVWLQDLLELHTVLG
jgi:hypothetical protein